MTVATRHPGLDPGSTYSLMTAVGRIPCVYLLASSFHGTLYTGVTSNLLGRTRETMETAIGREKSIKRWHRDWKIQLVDKENPTWRDLAEDFGIISTGMVESRGIPARRPG